MVVAWQLDYLVKTNVVELARFLPMDRVDCHDKLTVVMSPAILLAFPLSIVVLSLVCGLGLSLTHVFAKDCLDDLLTEGMACREVKQLPHCLWFVASKLMDECFIGHDKDERPDHIYVHDIRKLIAILGKAADVLM